MLNMTKTTPCGRFTVTITAADYPAGTMMTNQDLARSCKALSDILIEGSGTALRLAVQILESHGQNAKA